MELDFEIALDHNKVQTFEEGPRAQVLLLVPMELPKYILEYQKVNRTSSKPHRHTQSLNHVCGCFFGRKMTEKCQIEIAAEKLVCYHAFR